MYEILIVEDERIAAEDIRLHLENLGYQVSAIVSNGKYAIEKARQLQPDLILMDIMLKGPMDGIETAKEIRKQYDIPVVYLTAFADRDTLEKVKQTEPYGFILKPFEVNELHGVIETALCKYKMIKAIQDNEAWLSTTLRSIGDAVITTDRQGKVTFMNPVAEKLTGWSQDDAKDQPLETVFKIVNEDMKKTVENPVHKVIRKGRVVGLANHTLLISKDGTEIPIDNSGSPILDDKGDIKGVVLVFKDITERKQAEKERKQAEIDLRQSEEKYRSLVETHQNPIYLLDEKLQYLFANQIYLSRLGLEDTSRVIGQAYHQFHSLKNKNSFHKKVKKVFRSGAPLSYEYCSDRDGKYFVRTLSPVKDPVTGKTTAVTVISTDITQRKKAEEALRESEQRFKHVIQSIPMGIQFYDVESENRLVFRDANPAADQVLGVDNRQFVGKTIEEAFPTLKDTEYPDRYREAALKGKSWHTERIEYQDHEIASAFEVHTFQTKSGSAAALFLDITNRKKTEVALKRSEEQYRITLDSMKDAIHVIDQNFNILLMNKAFDEWNQTLGFQKNVIGQYLFSVFPFLDNRVRREYDDVFQNGKNLITEELTRIGDHEYITETRKIPIFDQGEVTRIITVVRDITKRKRAVEKIRESEELYRLLIDNASEAIALVDFDGHFLLINKVGAQILGGEPEDLIGKSFVDIFPKETSTAWLTSARQAALSDDGHIVELSIPVKDDTRWFKQSTQPFRDGTGKVIAILSLSTDITQIKKAEEQIHKDLKEKEILLKEIHHRVKNNLQIISSLLRLQSRYIQDENILKMFKESQHRIHSMALIHENLYQSSDFAAINFFNYVRNIAQDLYRSFGISEHTIELRIDISYISLSIRYAVPCGLIINELVSNALKYAFPKRFHKKAKIQIGFHSVGTSGFELSVSDNGIGLPKDFRIEDIKSLGLHLVTILAQDQLGGTFKILKKAGTHYKIHFKK